MLFKNKKKLDSKIRFQHRGFKSRLINQRNYKRIKKTPPQTDWGVFLSRAGLSSWLSRILTLLFFLFLIYIFYIPNLFFIKSVKFTGLDQPTQTIINNLTASFLNKKLPWPQKNLLLLSKSKFESFLLANNKDILKINKIEKDFPNTLNIDFIQRKETYLIQTLNPNYYVMAQDGLITSEIYPNASGTLPSGLILIKLNKEAILPVNQKPFKEKSFWFIDESYKNIQPIINTGLTNFEISDLENPYFEINTELGYKIKLDSKSDFNKSLDRLNLLLSQILPGDLKNLAYIDLRFLDRAYTCNKNSPCANTHIPNSTSTLESITNK